MRRYVLVMFVGFVAAGAIGLRLRSHLARHRAGSWTGAVTSRPAARIPLPRDYVVDPWVSPDEMAAGPRRIVSLAPSVTEIVCALGMRDRLVARTRYCRWPPGIESLPAVGVMAERNYGMVKALDPDLVLAAANSGDTAADLSRLGLPCHTVPHEGLDEVYAAIESIGQLCDRPKTAGALTALIRADIQRLRRVAAQLDVRPKRVLVLFGELPVPPKALFVSGPGLFLDSLVELAGHRNAARQLLKSSQGEIPLEVLRVLDPEMILEFRNESDGRGMDEVYRAWSRVGDLQAIRQGQVRCVGDLEWLSAGPRIAIELHRFIMVLSNGP